jgi:diguanylate cyclase (GGDEF)-like protein
VREQDRTSTGGVVLTRGLRAVRVVLSAVFIALVLTAGSGGPAEISGPAMAVVLAVACLNAGVNGLRALRPSDRPEPMWQQMAQLAVDGALALIATVVLDPTASPLAWVALLVPVLDAGAFFGPALAAVVWLSLGLAYVALRMRMLPPDSSSGELVRLGLQQMAAVAAVTIPTGYMAARLRDDLDRAHDTLMAAQRWVRELELVAAHSRRLTETTDPPAVLEQTALAARDLGFSRVDVCERNGAGRWRVSHAAGEGRSPDPTGDRALERAATNGTSTLIGAGGSPEEIQWLHLTGYAGGVQVPVWQSEGVVAVLRAWSHEPLEADESRVQALQVLTTQAAAAWGTASRYSTLAGWSRQVAHEASHDALTGLPNRANVMARLERSVERVAAGGPGFALLYLDLNGFKRVNDDLGHDAGDAVLVAVGQRLGRIARAADVAARLGGDEFVMVLDEIASAAEAVSVAERVCEVLSEPVRVGDATVPIGTSVGIARSTPGASADVLLRTADAAMYRVKRRGITGYALAGPEDERGDRDRRRPGPSDRDTPGPKAAS